MMGIGHLAAAALQAAAWQPLPLTTAIPPMLFVCTPRGESRPDFRRPWWQISVARTDAVNRVRLYQVGRGHVADQVMLENALTAYEVQREPAKSRWRMRYARGAESLTLEYVDPREEDFTNLSFVWRRPRSVMEGRCSQAPSGQQGWELREEAWR